MDALPRLPVLLAALHYWRCCTRSQVLARRLTEVAASCDMRTATLREAQASLSETEGKLHDEEEKNVALGRENGELQRQLLHLADV